MSSPPSNNAVDQGGGTGGGRSMWLSVCDLIKTAYEFVKYLWSMVSGLIDCLKKAVPCFEFVWDCVQLWTPLSVTFIMYWLIYRPDHFHPRIDSAALAAFDLTNNATTTTTTATPRALRYDLAVDLSFPNSRRVAIRYLDVAASVFYNGSRLGPTDDPLPSFYQGRKNTTIFHPRFHDVVTVDTNVVAELQRELDAGTVHIRVTVSLTVMYKVLVVRDVFFYKYDCWLWFPPPRNHTPALFPANGGTKCWRIR